MNKMKPYLDSLIVQALEPCGQQIKLFCANEMHDKKKELSLHKIEMFQNDSAKYGLPLYQHDNITEGVIALSLLRFQNRDTWCRVQVTDISTIDGGYVKVALPDHSYWGMDVELSNLFEHQLLCHPSSLPFEVFILADVVPTQTSGWSNHSIQFLRSQLVNKSIQAAICRKEKHLPLLRPYISEGKLLADSLVEFGMAFESPSFEFSHHIQQPPTASYLNGQYASPANSYTPYVAEEINPGGSLTTEPLNIAPPPPHLRFLAKSHEGAREECRIVHIEKGPLKFCIRLHSMESSFEMLTKYLKSITSEINLMPSALQTGLSALYKSVDNQFYRVLITDQNLKEGLVTIFLVDFGNTLNVPNNSLYSLPTELVKIPLLALRCRLQGIKTNSSQIWDNFTSISKFPMLVTVGKTDSDCLSEVYMELSNHCVSKLITQQIYNQQTLVSGTEVTASYICPHSGINYFKFSKNKEQLMLLDNHLEKGTSAPLLADAFRGLPCLAYSSEDHKWFRGIVLDATGENMTVRFVDTGNRRVLAKNLVRKIPENVISALPAQAAPAIVEVLDEQANVNSLDSITEENYIVTVLGHSFVKIDGLKTQVPKISITTAKNSAAVFQDNSNKNAVFPDLLKQCVVTHIESPSTFYVVFLENIHQIEELSSSLKKISEVNRQAFHVDQLVVLILSHNQKAHRCQIEQVMNDSLRLRMLDKGESLVAKKIYVSPLVEKFSTSEIPPLAIRCSLHGCPDNLTPEYKQKFSSFADQQVKVNFIKKEKESWMVSLLKTEDLTSNLLAASPSQEKDKASTPPAKFRDESRGFKRYDSNEGRQPYKKLTPPSKKPADTDNWRTPSSHSPPDYKPQKWERNPQSRGKLDFSEGKKSMPDWRMVDDRNTTTYSNDWEASNSEWASPPADWAASTVDWTDSKVPITKHYELKDLAPQEVLPSDMAAYISYFDDKLSLWLQRSCDTQMLKELHSAIQQSLKNLEEVKRLSTDSLCLAQSKEDNMWYRGQVVSAENNKASIYFIDFGNTEELTKSRLRNLPSSLLKYPMYAFPCFLRGDNDRSSLVADIEQEFDAQIVGKEGNKLIVTLCCNGKIYGAPPKEEEIKQAATQARNPKLSDSSEEKCPLFVSFVEPDGSIWVQRSEFTSELDVLMENLEMFADDCNPLTRLENGKLCSAKFSKDSGWYRGKILSCDNTKALIHYVDYGNAEHVCLHDLRDLPAECLSLPEQALHCKFFEAESQILPSLQSIPWLTECEFEGDLVKIDSDMYFIKNAAIDGEDLLTKINNELADHLSNEVSIAQQSIDENPRPFYVSYVGEDGTICAQLKESTSKLDTLMDYIKEYINTNLSRLQSASDPVGKYCLAKYQEDEAWYRVYVSGVISDDLYECDFIDYGNSDQIRKDETFTLPASFSVLPCQALHCKLDIFKNAEAINEGLLESLNSLSDYENLTGRFKLDGDVFILSDVCENSTKLEQLLDYPITECNNSDVPPLPTHSQTEVQDEHQEDEPTSLIVSYVEGNASFWVQKCESSDDLDALMDELDSLSETSKLLDVSNGALCSAKYSKDGGWYRGRVISFTENDAMIHYIDYGNSECVPLHDLRELPEQCKSLSVQAIHCKIFESPEELPPHSIEFLDESVIEAVLKETSDICLLKNPTVNGVGILDFIRGKLSSAAKVDPRVYSPNSISLPDKDVTDDIHLTVEKQLQEVADDASEPTILHESSEATLLPASTDTKEQSNLTSIENAGLCSLIITFIEIDGSMWVQKCESSEELDAVMEELVSHQDSCDPIEISEGVLCMAMYSKDSVWYRGKVISFSETKALIHFVDYGNSEYVLLQDLGKLPESCASLPPQAIHCRIFKEEEFGAQIESISWLSEAFIEAALEEEEDGTYLLKHATINGENLQKKIQEEISVVDPERRDDEIRTEFLTDQNLVLDTSHLDLVDPGLSQVNEENASVGLLNGASTIIDQTSLDFDQSEDITQDLGEYNENAKSFYTLSHVTDSQPSSMNTDFGSLEATSAETPGAITHADLKHEETQVQSSMDLNLVIVESDIPNNDESKQSQAPELLEQAPNLDSSKELDSTAQHSQLDLPHNSEATQGFESEDPLLTNNEELGGPDLIQPASSSSPSHECKEAHHNMSSFSLENTTEGKVLEGQEWDESEDKFEENDPSLAATQEDLGIPTSNANSDEVEAKDIKISHEASSDGNHQDSQMEIESDEIKQLEVESSFEAGIVSPSKDTAKATEFNDKGEDIILSESSTEGDQERVTEDSTKLDSPPSIDSEGYSQTYDSEHATALSPCAHDENESSNNAKNSFKESPLWNLSKDDTSDKESNLDHFFTSSHEDVSNIGDINADDGPLDVSSLKAESELVVRDKVSIASRPIPVSAFDDFHSEDVALNSTNQNSESDLLSLEEWRKPDAYTEDSISSLSTVPGEEQDISLNERSLRKSSSESSTKTKELEVLCSSFRSLSCSKSEVADDSCEAEIPAAAEDGSHSVGQMDRESEVSDSQATNTDKIVSVHSSEEEEAVYHSVDSVFADSPRT